MKLFVQNNTKSTTFFDMRVLKYFPKLKELIIRTNAIANFEFFEVSPDLKSLSFFVFGNDIVKESKILGEIGKNAPSIKILEIYPYPAAQINEAFDVSSVGNFPSLENFLSALKIKNLDSLSSLPNLRIFEASYSEDQFSTLPNNIEMFRYEIDTSSNLDNWEDQKIFSPKRFFFQR